MKREVKRTHLCIPVCVRAMFDFDVLAQTWTSGARRRRECAGS